MEPLTFFIFIALMMYYMMFIAACIEGDINTKKMFWLCLLPFGGVVLLIIAWYISLK